MVHFLYSIDLAEAGTRAARQVADEPGGEAVSAKLPAGRHFVRPIG